MAVHHARIMIGYLLRCLEINRAPTPTQPLKEAKMCMCLSLGFEQCTTATVQQHLKPMRTCQLSACDTSPELEGSGVDDASVLFCTGDHPAMLGIFGPVRT